MQRQVKLICGLLSADKALLEEVKKVIQRIYGKVDGQSEIFPFDFTSYYNDELGDGIWRQYISFSRLVHPEHLGRIKRRTIRLETKFKRGEKRRVNIDPGYLTLDKVVLATTKDSTYRIYLGNGIHAQSMLYFQNGSYHPWNWTYPDYRRAQAICFFNAVRKNFKK